MMSSVLYLYTDPDREDYYIVFMLCDEVMLTQVTVGH